MNLIEFARQVGTRDAFAIRARDLDNNFRRLRPKTNGTYGLNEMSDGWSLNIFPAFPEETTVAQALTLQDGALSWTDAEVLSISAGNKEGAHYITTISGSTRVGTWSSPPDIGGTTTTGGWRLVERCDGKQAYFWGTDWIDPA
jgi:hypothetical protein